MNLLIIGGTRFLGRHLATQALAAGHRVTLLNRGKSGPALFPEAEHLLADRDRDLDLAVLAGRRWDAALDTCAYFPRQVRSLAQHLAGSPAAALTPEREAGLLAAWRGRGAIADG